MSAKTLQQSIHSLRAAYPWTLTPLVVQAPMRILAGPALAVAASEAGGLGFLGPGKTPEDLLTELNASKDLIQKSGRLREYSTPLLPVGFGIQTWTGNLDTTHSILRQVAQSNPPCAAWLFAPRNGQTELDEWSKSIRTVSPRTKIWIQVASVADALAAARSAHAPDVLVIQGTDAGGHSRTKGAGILTLLPEVADALEGDRISGIPLIAAGGIADARGASAAMALGAAGVAMGTRFLATPEARISEGYQQAILDGKDGGQSTVRTQLYNHLRGTMGWPAEYDARGLVNASWRDHEAGVPFERNKELHDDAIKQGNDAWGEKEGRTATYAGSNVGLIKEIKNAGEIIRGTRESVSHVLKSTIEAVDALKD